jgi:membrane protease YdiL (CAAX protease family)
VAGIVEETAFRGYMQRPIERRHGPVVAILVTGLVFGALHFTHAEVTLALIPFYLAAAAVYGALAYFTDSTRPSIWLHAGGNAFSAFTLFTQGRSEWSLTATQPPLVWDTGVDGAFLGALAVFLVAAALTVLAYVGLARSRSGAHASVVQDDR